VAAKEKLLARFEGAALVEPRATYRGGPKLQTPIDLGAVVVTDRRVQFRGSTKSVEWRFDKMAASNHADDHVTFSVTNRALVSGIATTPGMRDAFDFAVQWGTRIARGDDLTELENEVTCTIVRIARETESVAC
jgi:hypothetical protein